MHPAPVQGQTMTKGTLLLAAAVAILASGPAMAASTFQYSGYHLTPNTQTIHISQPNAVVAGMGQIVLHGAGTDAGGLLPVWCLDIFHTLAGSGTYNISPLTTAGSGGSNPPLTTTQISQIGSLMINGGALIPSNANASAATQLAIWIIEYGAQNFIFSNVNSTVTTLANTFIGYLSNIWKCDNCSVSMLSGNGNSQVLGYGSPPGIGDVPLPGAVWLFAGGLVGLGMIARRRRKVAA
jgi:hypothetical protein